MLIFFNIFAKAQISTGENFCEIWQKLQRPKLFLSSFLQKKWKKASSWLFGHLSVRLSICLSVFSSVCPAVHLPVCLFVCLSGCPSVCLSFRLSFRQQKIFVCLIPSKRQATHLIKNLLRSGEKTILRNSNSKPSGEKSAMCLSDVAYD